MEHFVTFAVAMLTITNPIGALAIFAGMTADRSDSEKKTIRLQGSLCGCNHSLNRNLGW